MAHIGMAVIVGRFEFYDSAEGYADQYKGDSQIDLSVCVVEDFEPEWDHYRDCMIRFLVVVGGAEESNRYEIQYTA